jgi:amidase
MSELCFLEVTELAMLIAARKVSPVEVARAQLDRIDRLDGNLHSFVTLTRAVALAEATQAEMEIVSNRRRGALHGIPLGIKDLFWTKGVRTMAGTTIHRNFVPDRDATTVRRLREAGCTILGKLQMTEGAYSDHHPSTTPPVNPWDPGYWTGISSSGPGVALAAGLCHGALASDTGGSIRWPSAANGLTGIKPTWGRVSRDGAFELAASLDHVGTMARSAEDAALILDAVAGPDVRDPTTLPIRWRRLADEPRDLTGMRIGFDPVWNSRDVDGEVASALASTIGVLGDLDAELVEIVAPDVDDAIADWPTNCAVEAAIAHAATFPSRRAEYGHVLAGVLESGHALSGVEYQRILLRRMDLRGRFAALFADVDLLLCPVHPFSPLSLDAIGTMGERPDLIARLQRYTCPFDMTGGPTITFPVGAATNGMPIGAQLAAGHGCENVMISAAKAFQRATAWHRRHPPIDA